MSQFNEEIDVIDSDGHDDDDDDVWADDDDYEMEPNARNNFTSIRKAGYRQGKQRGEDNEMQRGFDEGFSRGAKCGEICGDFYADCLIEMEDFIQNSDQKMLSGGDVKGKGITYFKKTLHVILYENFDVSGKDLGSMVSKVKELFCNYDADSIGLGILLEKFESQLDKVEKNKVT